MVQEYETLKKLVDSIQDDILKANGGNKAAGIRVRKIMQDVKQYSQEIRKKVLEVRSSGEDEKPA